MHLARAPRGRRWRGQGGDMKDPIAGVAGERT